MAANHFFSIDMSGPVDFGSFGWEKLESAIFRCLCSKSGLMAENHFFSVDRSGPVDFGSFRWGKLKSAI